MDRRIAPSVQIEAAIEAALLDGFEEPDRLSELGRLGARLVLQRAVEDELAAFLGRARYERTRDATGSRNGHRPRRIQTAEGELTIAMPQVRDTPHPVRQRDDPRHPGDRPDPTVGGARHRRLRPGPVRP